MGMMGTDSGKGTKKLNINYSDMPHSDKKRQAKLVELVDKSLLPLYKFSHDSIDFRNPPSEEGSDLVYMTYMTKPTTSPEKIKHEAMKAFERDYKEMGIFLEGYYQDKDIKKQRETYENRLNNLDQLKAKNFYNPRKKDNLRTIKITGEGFALGFGGVTLMGDMEPSIGIPLTIGSLAGLEVVRRDNISNVKSDLKETNQNIQFYDNFRRNIENAGIHIKPVKNAAIVHKELRESDHPGRYAKIDFEQAYKDLKQAYGVY